MGTKDLRAPKRKVMPEMEGATARWYARNRGSAAQLAEYRRQAARLADGLPDGAAVLEVAPGPGYLAIELARLGAYRITGLDVSRTFVALAGEAARRAGVVVDFRQGDVHDLPFPAGAFDLVVCQAAFKNFVRPVRALDEMHRVLRPGGRAVIHDLRSDISAADIAREVAGMGLGRLDAFWTRSALRMLRRRAVTADTFARLAGASAFGGAEVDRDGGIGLEVRLTRAG
ncbi:class I SAM-dependent methyltransferase [Micromonospora sp. WMMC241]|uniref:class I SAM-dependent methyltransferase n=1 Tax=Micromonospora sp. WMMC241 TaxID=3015159 RepID=UPI0022B67891|nr:class I SAM-dependent methyltransferase [Micromonospora sp. WMMC241]MCZ7435221.1 class I SAM-dependent methyltransferase [Micromonospora sp. WMMC241]